MSLKRLNYLKRLAILWNRLLDRLAAGGPMWRRLALALGVLAVAAALYYPIGMIWVHAIDDDLTFGPQQSDITAGQSLAVARAAALIDREVNQHRWVANDPFFLPGAALDNMPNFQQGVIAAIARFAFELVDQIGRTRGSSQTDPDLQEAAGLLQYSGTKWVFDLSTSLAPTATSEAQYRKARRALLTYNARLAAGKAVFERRSDNLLATLDRIALGLGSASAVIEKQIARHGDSLIDRQADDLFYNVKGQAYGYAVLLDALAVDFAKVVEERDLGSVWREMQTSLHILATLDPLIVANGAPDGLIIPNHLAAEGFYLLRARTQLREITNILLK